VVQLQRFRGIAEMCVPIPFPETNEKTRNEFGWFNRIRTSKWDIGGRLVEIYNASGVAIYAVFYP
jgi:hypothetical protein